MHVIVSVHDWIRAAYERLKISGNEVVNPSQWETSEIAMSIRYVFFGDFRTGYPE